MHDRKLISWGLNIQQYFGNPISVVVLKGRERSWSEVRLGNGTASRYWMKSQQGRKRLCQQTLQMKTGKDTISRQHLPEDERSANSTENL